MRLPSGEGHGDDTGVWLRDEIWKLVELYLAFRRCCQRTEKWCEWFVKVFGAGGRRGWRGLLNTSGRERQRGGACAKDWIA